MARAARMISENNTTKMAIQNHAVSWITGPVDTTVRLPLGFRWV
jgi:hypothetical protein